MRFIRRCVESAQGDGGRRAAAGWRQDGEGWTVGHRWHTDPGQRQSDTIFDPVAEIPLGLVIRFVDAGRLNEWHRMHQPAGQSAVDSVAEKVSKGFLLIVVQESETNAEQKDNDGDDGQKDDVEFDLK